MEVRISRSVSEGPFNFEIMRVDCICDPNGYDLNKSEWRGVPNASSIKSISSGEDRVFYGTF